MALIHARTKHIIVCTDEMDQGRTLTDNNRLEVLLLAWCYITYYGYMDVVPHKSDPNNPDLAEMNQQ